MLFNTLAYARFFGLVFVATWLLVERRNVLLLPWLTLAGYSAFAAPSWLSLGLSTALLLPTVVLLQRSERGAAVAWVPLFGSFTLNLGALTFLALRDFRLDPLSLALSNLNLPVVPSRYAQWVLLLVVAVGLAVVARLRRIRLVFLVVVSYVFYAHWDWRFLPLIWGSSTVDWLLGRAIGNSEDPRRRRLWLAGTVALNLSVLGIFKYFNFGVDSARALLDAAGIQIPEITLRIALPVGISFFTFESMSYVIDVYRRQIQPHRSYLEYLGFVAFFPHLVAGPIIRPRDLLPQLSAPACYRPKEASEGLYLIAMGLMKKVVIGDVLAVNLVDRVFDAPLMYSGLENYAAVLGYALQIYCDFSGYTDIAIGSAQLLGIRFPLNFNAPYQATSIADFWHRWHISLSSWLRDYLYISLGGNRKGSVRTTVNLLLTMLLGGLWHGANWTFVVWGGIHGVALGVNRILERRRKDKPSPWREHPAYRILCQFTTFHLVCVGWIFFRAETFTKAATVFSRIASGTTYHPNLPPLILGTLALGFVTHALPVAWDRKVRERFVGLPVVLQGLCLLVVAIILRRMASAESVPFVYFQF